MKISFSVCYSFVVAIVLSIKNTAVTVGTLFFVNFPDSKARLARISVVSSSRKLPTHGARLIFRLKQRLIRVLPSLK